MGGGFDGADRLAGDLRSDSVPFDDGDLKCLGHVDFRFESIATRFGRSSERTIKPTESPRWA